MRVIRSRRLGVAMVTAAVALLLVTGVADAHIVKTFGKYTVALGWVHEPTYVGEQNAAFAVQFLRDHRGHVAEVTIDVGSNDVLNDQCVPNGNINTGCALSAIQTVRTNLDTIVRTLRSNLDGRTVRAAGMTYYDPLLALWPSPVASPQDPRRKRVSTARRWQLR